MDRLEEPQQSGLGLPQNKGKYYPCPIVSFRSILMWARMQPALAQVRIVPIIVYEFLSDHSFCLWCIHLLSSESAPTPFVEQDTCCAICIWLFVAENREMTSLDLERLLQNLRTCNLAFAAYKSSYTFQTALDFWVLLAWKAF